jgi:hypothetical protein
MSFIHRRFPQVWETAVPGFERKGAGIPGRSAADYSSGLCGRAKENRGLGDLFALLARFWRPNVAVTVNELAPAILAESDEGSSTARAIVRVIDAEGHT